LERAVARGEATQVMILQKQTFFYLGYDARSTKVKNDLEANRGAIQAALNEIAI
jgi:hypothetical protein